MPALDPADLWGTLERIVALGNRFAGTPGEARCRELVSEELSGAGLANVRLEEFRYLGYEPERSSCTVLADGAELPCAGLQYSADAAVEGEAVYLGACRPEDVEAIERAAWTSPAASPSHTRTTRGSWRHSWPRRAWPRS